MSVDMPGGGYSDFQGTTCAYINYGISPIFVQIVPGCWVNKNLIKRIAPDPYNTKWWEITMTDGRTYTWSLSLQELWSTETTEPHALADSEKETSGLQ
jgi:hypothetical protein